MSTNAEYIATGLMYKIINKINVCDYYVSNQECNHCIIPFENSVNSVVGIDPWGLNMIRVLRGLR